MRRAITNTHSIFVGALTHNEIFSQSESRTKKSNVNSPGISYGLNIERTRISFPKSGASSSTISSSSVPASETFVPEGGETEREFVVVFVPLATSERAFKTTIGGGEREEWEMSMSLSELFACAPRERLVDDACPLVLTDCLNGDEGLSSLPGQSSFCGAGEMVTIGVVGWGMLDSTGVAGGSCFCSTLGAGDDFLGRTLLVSLSGVGDLRCFPEAGGTSATEVSSVCSSLTTFE